MMTMQSKHGGGSANTGVAGSIDGVYCTSVANNMRAKAGLSCRSKLLDFGAGTGE
jgi:hypothetical protein